MLALLSKTTHNIFQFSVEANSDLVVLGPQLAPCSSTQPIDVRDVVMHAPSLSRPLHRVAGACGRTYEAVQSIVCDDVESLTELFSDLESDSEFDGEEACNSEDEDCPYLFGYQLDQKPDDCEDVPLARRPQRARRKRSPPLGPSDQLYLHPDDPSIPSIVITTCSTLPRHPSCLTPFQDACFRNRLTVPTHPAVNSAFPPLLPPTPLPSTLVARVEQWSYDRGHWSAVLPTVEEQARQGLFSRGVRVKNVRRRRRQTRTVLGR